MENEDHEYFHVLEGKGEEILQLCQGENWLRLFVSAQGFDLLADTQDDDPVGIPNASIISLKEVGTVEWPTDDCFICIDVDEDTVAVKDMRKIGEELVTELVVCLQRRLNTPPDSLRSGGNDCGDLEDSAYEKLEEIPRRQMRIVYPGDRLCTLTTTPRTDELSQEECTGHLGLELTYRRYHQTDRLRFSNTQVSQLTAPSFLDVPPSRPIIVMNTQDSQQTKTQKLGSQLSSSKIIVHLPSTQEDEKIVEGDHDSDIEDDGEQTQLFPLATQEEDKGGTISEAPKEERLNHSSKNELINPILQNRRPEPLPNVVDNCSESNVQPEGNTVGRNELISQDDGYVPSGHCSADKSGHYGGYSRCGNQNIEEKVTCFVHSCETGSDVPDGNHMEYCTGTKSLAPNVETYSDSLGVHAEALSAPNKAPIETAVDDGSDVVYRDDCDDETVLDDNECTTLKRSPTERLQVPLPPISTEVEVVHEFQRVDSSAEILLPICDIRIDDKALTNGDSNITSNGDRLLGDKSDSTSLSEVIHKDVQVNESESVCLETSRSRTRVNDQGNLLEETSRLCNPRSHVHGAGFVLESGELLIQRSEDRFVGKMSAIAHSLRIQPSSQHCALPSSREDGVCPTEGFHSNPSEHKNIGNVDTEAHSSCLILQETEGTNILPIECSSTRPFELQMSPTRKRVVGSLRSVSKLDRKTRSEVQGLEIDGDTSQSTHSIESRKRQRKEFQKVHVLVTGVPITAGHRNKIMAIGGTVLASTAEAIQATHVIVSDGIESIRRTPKLMIALCKTSNIVSMKWLDDSARKRKALPVADYLVLNDVEAEKKYSFNMLRTLQNGDNLRQRGKTILNGRNVFFCKGVAGNKAPPEDELKLIVHAAGGTWIRVASSLKEFGNDHTIIITSDPPSKGQLSNKHVAKAIKEGMRCCSTSWLFNCLLRQEFNDM